MGDLWCQCVIAYSPDSCFVKQHDEPAIQFLPLNSKGTTLLFQLCNGFCCGGTAVNIFTVYSQAFYHAITLNDNQAVLQKKGKQSRLDDKTYFTVNFKLLANKVAGKIKVVPIYTNWIAYAGMYNFHLTGFLWAYFIFKRFELNHCIHWSHKSFISDSATTSLIFTEIVLKNGKSCFIFLFYYREKPLKCYLCRAVTDTNFSPHSLGDINFWKIIAIFWKEVPSIFLDFYQHCKHF